MRKKLSVLLFALLGTCVMNFCSAKAYDPSDKSHNPFIPFKWVGPKGYWVIESNKKNPKNSIIYFYTNENVLMYKEAVNGMKINVNRKKVLTRLNNVLEASAIAWQKQHQASENEMLVTLAMKR
ncbi:MAG: hypothetical protein ACM3VS_16545 [Candidatus Dadabacteria bacterium]